MTKIPNYWNKAKKYLSKKDRVMSNLINQYRSPSEKILTTRKDIFYSLCKSIIGQQISVAAANSVFKKFSLLCDKRINAKRVLKIKNSVDEMQASHFQRFPCVGCDVKWMEWPTREKIFKQGLVTIFS